MVPTTAGARLVLWVSALRIVQMATNAAIEAQLELDFGTAPAVIVRTVPDLERIMAASPFPKKGADPARHHVTFLATKPAPERLAAFSAPPSGRDELAIVGQEKKAAILDPAIQGRRVLLS